VSTVVETQAGGKTGDGMRKERSAPSWSPEEAIKASAPWLDEGGRDGSSMKKRWTRRNKTFDA